MVIWLGASLIQSTHYYFFIIQGDILWANMLISSLWLVWFSFFLLNKYEKERLQKLYQEQLLKDETFRADIKEKIHTTENINDVIAYINKTYHLGMLLSKDITDQLK